MDTLLAKAESADALQARVLEAADSLEKVSAELRSVLALRHDDGLRIIELEANLIETEARRAKAVQQRNVALAVTGSVLLGAVAATYVTSRVP